MLWIRLIALDTALKKEVDILPLLLFLQAQEATESHSIDIINAGKFIQDCCRRIQHELQPTRPARDCITSREHMLKWKPELTTQFRNNQPPNLNKTRRV